MGLGGAVVGLLIFCRNGDTNFGVGTSVDAFITTGADVETCFGVLGGVCDRYFAATAFCPCFRLDAARFGVLYCGEAVGK